MKRLLLQVFLFLLLISLILLGISYQADGFTDEYYLRFTSPKQTNLILGTSRAAQGIRPDALKSELNMDVFNFAFTVIFSPYGKVYLESVKKKVEPETKDGTFILCIDPWSIGSITEDPNDTSKFRELEHCLNNTPIVDMNPNVIYLYHNLSGNYFKIISKKDGSVELKNDGWLDVSVPMDEASIAQRTNRKIEAYREEYKPQYLYSSVRVEYLKKTVSFLNQHGNVYLVRLPVHSKLLEIENDYMPDFSEKIKDIIPLTEGYFDMSLRDPNNTKYQYTDGNHLYKESGTLVTQEIAQWIKTLRSN